ncbi:MAG: hypothetical protein WCJ94_00190 [bacterium]
MKSKTKFVKYLIIVFLLSSCASMQLPKNILEFQITPETGIKAGTIVTVNIKTSEDVTRVLGSLDMMGSPQIPLKYDESKKVWYLRRMIPIGVMIPSGEYITKVEVITKSGEHYYAEKKIKIQ